MTPVAVPSPTVVPGPKLATVAPEAKLVSVPVMVMSVVTAIGAVVGLIETQPRESCAGPWSMPMPLTPSECGLPLALSVKVSVAERKPEAVGVNLIGSLVLVPGAMVIGVAAKTVKSVAFAPANPITEITRLPVPEFEITICVGLLVVLTSCAANVIWPGEMPIAGARPIPESASEWGLPPALSVSVKVALRGPGLAGVNTMVNVVLAPGVTVSGNVDGEKEKSLAFVPVTAAAEITRFALPVFVTVTTPELLLVLTSWLPNEMDPGETVIEGRAGAGGAEGPFPPPPPPQVSNPTSATKSPSTTSALALIVDLSRPGTGGFANN